jgi:hypothetical protein
MKKILVIFSLVIALGAVSCTNENKRTDEVTTDKKTVDGTPVTVTKEVDNNGVVVVPVPPPPRTPPAPPLPPRPPTPKQVIKSLPKPPLPPPPPLPRKGG